MLPRRNRQRYNALLFFMKKKIGGNPVIEYYQRICGSHFWLSLLFVLFLLMLAGCGNAEDDLNSSTAVPESTAKSPEQVAEVMPTWTQVPFVAENQPDPTKPAPPTSTTVPTSTVVAPTDTPEATATDTPEPTATDVPATATSPPAPTSPPSTPVPTAPPESLPPNEPTLPAEPVLGVNLLPNPSFEEGHYNQNGVPELQLPNKWRLEWDEGPTGVGNAAWDYYVRPEVRVLSTAFLPPEEHSLYIYNGQHTVKAFKGAGAVNFRLMTDITLEPGTYVIEAKMFADIVEKWENREKQWAQDPTAAEFRFLVGDGGTVWTGQNFGQVNVHNFTFTIDETRTIPIGIALRGKYAIANNGWFIDDLSVRRVE